MTICTIGIDPGADGGIAFCSHHGDITIANSTLNIDMKTKAGWIRNICGEFSSTTYGIVEKPALMITDRKTGKKLTNAKSLVKNAKSQGEWVGMLYCHCKNVIQPTAQEWQTFVSGMPGENAKARVMNYLKKLEPLIYENFCFRENKRTKKNTVYLDGVADAIVMALWGYMTLKG